MVKLKMFVVYDDKAKAYLQPFFFPEIGQAVRFLHDSISDPQSMLAKHPEDFSLFYCGEFDSLSGIVTAEKSLLHVANVLELRADVQKRAEQLALALSRNSAKE